MPAPTRAERKRAEALAEIDRAKTAFFSNVSHEFRTPLSLMLGPVEDLLDKSFTELSPSSKGQLEIVHRNSLRLLKLVNAMLDFSRIEAGRIQANYEETDLAALTAELASNFRSACERAGLSLKIDCPPLPTGTAPAYVDRDMWEKIVLNLVSNAFKFTLEGEIRVELSTDDGQARLIVRDTGIGIPAEEIPHLFARFHRVAGSRGRTHEGTGIGLALVRELAKLHGGAVDAQSELGRGSTFTVSIPLGRAHLDPAHVQHPIDLAFTRTAGRAYVEEAASWLPGPAEVGVDQVGLASPRDSAPAARDGASMRAVPRPRLLWAEDNADMREYVQRLLSDRYEVEAETDGRAALEKAQAMLKAGTPPDLVLSDIMMPRLDGLSLMRELRADPALASIPIVLLSARAGEEALIEGIEAGADDYLVKPFSAKELLARVEAHLKLAALRREAHRAVQDSERRLAATQANAPIGIVELTLDGRYTSVNDAFCRLTGYTREQLLSYDDITFAEDRPHNQDLFQKLVAGDIPSFELEKRFVRSDGALIWANVHCTLVTNTSGEPLYVVGAIINISERKRAIDALRAAHDTFRHLVDHSPFGVYVVDADFRLVRISDGAQKVFENVRPLIGRDFAEVLRTIWPEPCASEAVAKFQHTLATAEPYHCSNAIEKRADIEATETYDWKIERLTLPDGRAGVVCHFYDLSERQRHEDHTKLLMREINHRSKNMLGLIQAMARQTAAGNPHDFVRRFSERVQSLSASQNVLAARHRHRAFLRLSSITSCVIRSISDC